MGPGLPQPAYAYPAASIGRAPARAVSAPPRATFFDIAEAVVVSIILLLLSQALVGPLFNPAAPAEGAEWLRTMWLPIYAVMVVLAAWRAPHLASVWPGGLMMLGLIAYAFVTVAWSVAPDITIRRAVALTFCTLFGLYLAGRYSWRQMLELIAFSFLFLAVGSFIVCLAVPSIGIDHELHVGAWRGLWYEKNAFGGAMAKGTLACIVAALLSPQRRKVWTGAAVFCALLVPTSTSTTAIIGLAFVLAGVVGIRMLRRGGAQAVAAVWLGLLGLLAVFALFEFAPELFFKAVGKDASLSGRTGIWEAMMRQIDQQPWRGFGYGAFWRPESVPGAWVRKEVQWNVVAADNGWYDLLAQTGRIGVGLFSVTLVAGFYAAFRSLWRGRECYWAILWFALLCLFSLSESVLMKPNAVLWVIYVATLAKLLQTGQARAPADR
ncbi:MAG TPA: O-antigen ligase [Caulobacteraceae bacterium]|jgi:O-antigen ligase